MCRAGIVAGLKMVFRGSHSKYGRMKGNVEEEEDFIEDILLETRGWEAGYLRKEASHLRRNEFTRLSAFDYDKGDS